MSTHPRGWHVVPATPAQAPPIIARAWLLAALNTCGRHLAPERPGHPADLEDGGGLVDSIVLTAVLQRHFLKRAAPAWDDATLGRDLGLDAGELERAQRVLDAVRQFPVRMPMPAPTGDHWWRLTRS